ncbi:MAG: ADP-ribosylglycohydrolase family protein [Muribaculaceae bacterium]|nr:ADP-ribosylglycohydrolase family protein [Muribaculaceae bacterium]MDE6770047.1 ADP-ribosylglycohydrolase family protein [Muribaculaceae bacterium]
MDINLRERIAGLLYGYAIGDALGIGTELMPRKIVEKKYPNGLTDYSQIVRDAHRSQWQRGEWSNDTNYVLMLVDSICDKEAISHLDYARKLGDFFKTRPDDITTHMRWVLSRPDYTSDPYGVARKAWIDMKDEASPSDNLGRALIIGVWNENVTQNAIYNCRLTHPKPRCETAAAVIANMANSILWKGHEVDYETIHDMVKRKNIETLDYIESAHSGTLEDFDLDDRDTYWYVRKAMGAALWAVWHCKSPNEALVKIVNEGGDADTNAALAIGLLGLKYGVNALDRKYIDNLIGAEKIEAATDKLTALLKKKFLNEQPLD